MIVKIAASLLAVALFAVAPLAHADSAFAQSKGCPPGLAKKFPPCVPPGLAKKAVTTNQWLSRDRTGEVVYRDDLIFLDDYVRYDLPPLPNGQRYAVIDDRIVVIDRESYQILRLIRLFGALAE